LAHGLVVSSTSAVSPAARTRACLAAPSTWPAAPRSRREEPTSWTGGVSGAPRGTRWAMRPSSAGMLA
jgi:hypothetical protein